MRYRLMLCASAAARYVFCSPGVRSWLPSHLTQHMAFGMASIYLAEDSGRAVCTVLPDCLPSTSLHQLAVLHCYSLCLQMICRAYCLTSLWPTMSELYSLSVLSSGYSRTPYSNLCIVSITGRPSHSSLAS